MLDYRNPAGMRSFHPSAFKGVIFGAQTANEHKKLLLNLADRRGGEVAFWQASLSETQYILELRQLA